MLEVNFPAFFAAAQRASGVDIAGGMIEFLIAKAVRSPASRTTS